MRRGFFMFACQCLLYRNAIEGLGDVAGGALKGDTVVWEMAPPRGVECLQGLRWSYMQIFEVALVTPPKYGRVEIMGSGFRYTPDPAAAGKADRFKLHVLGKNRRDNGFSAIEISIAASTALSSL